MDIKTRGIVLHSIKYSETSVIVKILTERIGLVSYIVNGVRTSKSTAKAALLRPMSLLDLDVSHRENKGLQRLKEYKRAYQYHSIPFDTLKSSISMFLLEVITKSLKEHDTNEELFEFVYESFIHLDELKSMNNNFHLQFLLHYATYLGFGLAGQYSIETPYFDMQEGLFIAQKTTSSAVLDKTESEYISSLFNNPLSLPSPLSLNRQTRKQLLQSLLKYYQYHLDGFGNLKSPEVLEVLFD